MIAPPYKRKSRIANDHALKQETPDVTRHDSACAWQNNVLERFGFLLSLGGTAVLVDRLRWLL